MPISRTPEPNHLQHPTKLIGKVFDGGLYSPALKVMVVPFPAEGITPRKPPGGLWGAEPTEDGAKNLAFVIADTKCQTSCLRFENKLVPNWLCTKVKQELPCLCLKLFTLSLIADGFHVHG